MTTTKYEIRPGVARHGITCSQRKDLSNGLCIHSERQFYGSVDFTERT